MVSFQGIKSAITSNTSTAAKSVAKAARKPAKTSVDELTLATKRSLTGNGTATLGTTGKAVSSAAALGASYGILKTSGRRLSAAGRKLAPTLHGKASSLADKTIGKVTKPIGSKLSQAKAAVSGQLAKIPGVGRLFR